MSPIASLSCGLTGMVERADLAKPVSTCSHTRALWHGGARGVRHLVWAHGPPKQCLQ